MDPEYQRCPWCHTDRPIKKNGTFRKHHDSAKWSIDRRICQGSGKLPEYLPFEPEGCLASQND